MLVWLAMLACLEFKSKMSQKRITNYIKKTILYNLHFSSLLHKMLNINILICFYMPSSIIVNVCILIVTMTELKQNFIEISIL